MYAKRGGFTGDSLWYSFKIFIVGWPALKISKGTSAGPKTQLLVIKIIQKFSNNTFLMGVYSDVLNEFFNNK